MSPSPTSLQQAESMRLNRAIASRGYCSRRKADELIFQGKVKVNGKIEQNPSTQVLSSDVLEINGQILENQDKKFYVLLNKPVCVVCTVSDPEGRKTVLDVLPAYLRKYRLFPVGRLDYFSEGLLLLTNDGDFAQKMGHPSNNQAKVYEVIVRGKVDPATIKTMENGMTLADGTKLRPIKVSCKELPSGDTLLTMELHQGINRQIRKMCEYFGLVILKLKRVRQGRFSLGNLRPGECKVLAGKDLPLM